MKINKTALLFVVVTMISCVLSAQKYGYINSQQLIIELPEVQAANKQLETLKIQLQTQGQNMILELQKKAAALDAKKPELAPIEYDKQAQALKEDQAKIQEFEGSSQKQLYDKSAELLNPVEERVNAAIKELAKEEGYNYIFDMSQGFILYADPSTDVYEKIKAKLIK